MSRDAVAVVGEVVLGLLTSTFAAAWFLQGDWLFALIFVTVSVLPYTFTVQIVSEAANR